MYRADISPFVNDILRWPIAIVECTAAMISPAPIENKIFIRLPLSLNFGMNVFMMIMGDRLLNQH